MPDLMTPRAALSEMFVLTERQADVLLAIMQYRDQHGYSPSYRELAKLLDIESLNGVVYHIEALTRKGALDTDGTARSLVPRVEVVRVTRPLDT